MTFLTIWLNQTTVTEPDGLKYMTSNVVLTAGRCTIRLCVKNFYSAAFSGGRLIERQVANATTDVGTLSPVTPLGSNLSFTADVNSWEGFAKWLITLLSGAYDVPHDFGKTYKASTDARDAVFQVLIGGRVNTTLQSLFDNVANSLTYAVRIATRTISSGAGPVVNGISYVAETIVQADWAWLSFPFTLWALILLYTVAMISISRHAPNWKAQTVATLCHGLDEEEMVEVARLLRSSEIEQKAENLYVKLVTGQEWL